MLVHYGPRPGFRQACQPQLSFIPHPLETVLFLKSLHIHGFKSFARPTRFEFTSGITALVGPNGSGKSNIVDAMRWCLGEQSARDLRGARAEDVIYAGARHALGAAEVSMVFTPSAGDTPDTSDVTIARRVFRSGESEYLLDGHKVRLRDVLSALRRMGIDGSRHIVVTQGMADALLAAGPLERRTLLEAAAGLSEYRSRRDESRQKLATTEQNIEMVGVVIQELEPRLRLLRRQARAVQDRDEAQALLHSRLHEWHYARFHRAAASEEALRERAETAKRARQDAERRLRELEDLAETALEDERGWQRTMDECAQTGRSAERVLDEMRRRSSEVLRLEQSAQERLRSASDRAETLHPALAEVNERIATLHDSVSTATEEIDRTAALVAAAASELQSKRDSLSERQQFASAIQRQASMLARELDELDKHVAALRRTIEPDRSSVAELQIRLERSQVSTELSKQESHELQTKTDGIAAQLVILERQMDAAAERLGMARTRSERLEAIVRRSKRIEGDLTRREDHLRRTVESFTLSSGSGLLFRLHVQSGWELAIAAALGRWSWASDAEHSPLRLYVAEDPDFIRWRDGIVPPSIDIMWAESVVDGLAPVELGPLRTTLLVGRDEALEPLWRRVADSAAHLISTTPVQIVSKRGHRRTAVGLELRPEDSRATDYLLQRREYDVVVRRSSGQRERLTRLQATQRDAALVLATCRTNEEAQRRAGDACSQSLDATTHRHAVVVRHLQELSRESGRLTAEIDAIQARMRKSADIISECDDRRMQLAELHEKKAHEASVAEEQVALLRDAVQSATAAERDMIHARHLAETKLETEKRLQDAARAERQRLNAELEALSKETTITRDTLNDLAQQRSGVEDEIVRQEQHFTAITARLDQLRAERPTSRVDARTVRDARATATEHVSRHERIYADWQIAEAAVTAIRADIGDDLGISAEELRTFEGEPPAIEDIKRLRARANQYADADDAVVKEAMELGERHEYLLRHLRDLRDASSALRDMMETADAEMNTRFHTAFGAVNEEFARMFQVMLRGGEAHLQCSTDSGGVEIVARLPGKRDRSSASFSGGERSLVASSLLFGVLRMRPTPFCVLDEVDAALDEGNVDRYLAALRDISTRTQVIVVTHNRATMAAADALYGLTMNDQGASNVLSLRLDADARAAQELAIR